MEFLESRQRPDGRFRVDETNAWTTGGIPVESHSLFATALIATSLLALDDPHGDAMAERAGRWLLEQRRPGGTWGFYLPASHDWFRTAPLDTDDTACVAQVLERVGLPYADVRPVLLAARDPRGRIFTWLVPRRSGPPPRSRRFWEAAALGWRVPLKRAMFWRVTPANPFDVDGGVNANVLLHLGDGPHAPAITEYLCGIVEQGLEGSCDKWYQDPIIVQYCIARVHGSGIPGLERVRGTAVDRLRGWADPSGRIGGSTTTTAIAACAMRSWGYEGPEWRRALEYLVATQLLCGGWEAGPVYYGGDSSWGSGELTTGFCVEALSAPKRRSVR